MSVDLFKSRGHLLRVGENKAKEGIHHIERFFWATFRPSWIFWEWNRKRQGVNMEFLIRVTC